MRPAFRAPSSAWGRILLILLLVAGGRPLAGARAQFASVAKVTQDAQGRPLSQAGDRFGAAVANLGPDPTGELEEAQIVGVGAPGADDDTGAVYGLALDASGAPRPVSVTLPLIGTRTVTENGVLSTLAGDDPGDRFGASFASATSVTPGGALATGFVGAPGDDDETGEAYAYGLRLGSGSFTVELTREATYNESQVGGLALAPGDRFGAAIDTLGNVDGDDLTTEVAFGAPGANDGEGAVYVLSIDRSSGAATLFATLESETLGGVGGGGFGSSISNVGALGGEATVAIGAAARGMVYLLSLSARGRATLLATRDGRGERFGASVAQYQPVGGYPTLVVGAPGGGGGAFGHYVATQSDLSRAGRVRAGDLAGVSLSEGDRLAASLAGVPEDLDSNGFNELLAGAPGDDENGPGAGAAYVLFADASVLPVEFAGAPVPRVDGNDVALRWATLTETGNAGFYVEYRRVGGASGWTAAHDALIEGAGTTNAKRAYRFTMRDLAAGRYVFRVRQVDTDGRQSRSPASAEVEVGTEGFALRAASRNPVRPGQVAVLRFSVPGEDRRGEAALYNSLGQQVRRLEARNGAIRVAPRGLASGVYFVRFTDGARVAARPVTVVR